MKAQRMLKKNVTGFTLIELMIVVAVIGILAAIAYPSYIESVRKTREGQMREAAMRVGTALERIVSQSTEYPATAPACDYADVVTCSYTRNDTSKRAYTLTATNEKMSLWLGINSLGTRCACRNCTPTFADDTVSCPSGTRAF